MPVLKNIYRYPIKGLSAQPLTRVALQAKQPFPHDRVYALVRPGAPFDTIRPQWGKKGLFVMLMLEEALARVQTTLDVETQHLTIRQDGRQLLVADLHDEAARAKVEEFVWQLVPALRSAPVLVRSPDGHFMDKPDNVISLINLATVRSLEEQWGIRIDPLRFRANLYIDGARPWEEFEWVGSDIRIGDVVFRVDRRNGRCGATNVNPETGRRDLDLPSSLRAAFGHKELGIYLIAAGGWSAVGRRPAAYTCHHRGHPSPARAVGEAAGGPAEIHLWRVLFHLRARGRPAGSIDPARYPVLRDPAGLEMPRLRHRENHVPRARRAAAFDNLNLNRTATARCPRSATR